MSLRAFGDPSAEITSFSAFKEVDLAKLMRGEIMSIRSPAMSFQRGLSVQFCYIVPLPSGAADLHHSFNGASHPELKVFLHSALPSKPRLEHFAKLKSAPASSSVQSFADATQHIDAHPGMQVSSAELKAFNPAGGQGGGGALPGPVFSYWSNVLQQRRLPTTSPEASDVNQPTRMEPARPKTPPSCFKTRKKSTRDLPR